MNAERLLALYDRTAEAPDATPHLCGFVLYFAVRGKLVKQDSTDEPATALLTRTEQNRENGGGLPENWCRVQLGDILLFSYGKHLLARMRAESGPVPVYGSNGIVGYAEEALSVAPCIIVGRKGSAGALNKCISPSWTKDVAYFVEVPDFLQIDFLFLSLSTLELNALAKGVKPGLSRADAIRAHMAKTVLHRAVATSEAVQCNPSQPLTPNDNATFAT